ncbi:MAG: hypothetical protein ACE5ES_00795 [Candidatus Nanoarchaeia archaeon]
MKDKRGQLKIQQMAFMLMAVTLFFVLAGMFVLVVGFSGLKDQATELEARNAQLLVTKLANSPEFSCGESFGSERINCIDGDKVMMLRENAAKYVEFWGKGVSNIEIRKISTENTRNTIVCGLGNYPNCNTIRVFNREVSGTFISNFVSLCRKDVSEEFEGEVYDHCELALVMIGYERTQ